ncbi:MAG TPA: PilZ domain-containing protein [Nitrospira sp.]|nr:PilZ domain-containing protein [Nitrospira sp.]
MTNDLPRQSESDGAERRGRRLKVNHRLFFFGDDDYEGEATILDISTGGCRACSLTDVQVGMLLKLSMFLQDQPWPLRIDESIVRWVNGQTFGLEFIGIRPAQRERLRTILMRNGK